MINDEKGDRRLREVARIYKAVADESRLRILVALAERRYGVCDLAKCLGLSQPTLSHHLKILRETGLVHAEREGQSTWCTLNRATFEQYGISLEKLLEYGRSPATSTIGDLES